MYELPYNKQGIYLCTSLRFDVPMNQLQQSVNFYILNKNFSLILNLNLLLLLKGRLSTGLRLKSRSFNESKYNEKKINLL